MSVIYPKSAVFQKWSQTPQLSTLTDSECNKVVKNLKKKRAREHWEHIVLDTHFPPLSVDVTLSVKKHQSFQFLKGTFQFSLLKTKRVQGLYNSRQCQRAKTAIKEQWVIKTMMTSSKVHAMEGVIISVELSSVSGLHVSVWQLNFFMWSSYTMPCSRAAGSCRSACCFD